MTEVGPLSAEELLARSAAAVKSGNTTKNQSAVQKLMAQCSSPIEDNVDLSDVQKLLKQQQKDAKKIVNYFESDDYIRMKVSQLRGQLAIYTSMPGLDPSGAVVGGIEAEVRAILKKQQAALQESTRKATAAQEKLKENDRLKALELPSASALLAKIQGTAKPPALSKEVQALLTNAKNGTTVNQTV